MGSMLSFVLIFRPFRFVSFSTTLANAFALERLEQLYNWPCIAETEALIRPRHSNNNNNNARSTHSYSSHTHTRTLLHATPFSIYLLSQLRNVTETHWKGTTGSGQLQGSGSGQGLGVRAARLNLKQQHSAIVHMCINVHTHSHTHACTHRPPQQALKTTKIFKIFF